MRWTLAAILSVALALPAAARADHFQADDPKYIAPLIGQYAVERVPTSMLGAGTLKPGSCGLVIPDYGLNTNPKSEILPDIQKIAIAGRFIVGMTGPEYFIFDTQDAMDSAALFDAVPQWQAALNADGFPSVKLQDPDLYAASLPDAMTHPWNYQYMHGRWHLSDDDWCAMVITTGISIAFLIGLTHHPRRFRWFIIVMLALAADFIGEGQIEQGANDGHILGAFFYPIFYCVAAFLGILIRRVFFAIRRLSVKPQTLVPL